MLLLLRLFVSSSTSFSFPSVLPTPPAYPQFPHISSLTKFHFFHEIRPTPLSYALIRTCFFKIKCSEEWKWSESVILSAMSNSLRPLDCSLSPWDYPGKNTGVGYHLYLQGIFQTQGSNLSLPHCRQILYHLSTREAYILRVQKLNPSFLICPGLKLSCKL